MKEKLKKKPKLSVASPEGKLGDNSIYSILSTKTVFHTVECECCQYLNS